jgi:hypothetical protein
MSQVNPYASPQMSSQPPIPAVIAGGPPVGLFRQGDLLVMHRYAVLPEQCIYTAEKPTPERLQQELTYRDPWVWLTIFLGLLPFIIISVVVSKRASVAIPIHQSIWDTRSMWASICWGLFGLGLVVFGGGLGWVVMAKPAIAPAAAGLMIAGGVVTMLVAGITAVIAFRGPSVYFMDEHYIWISGTHERFLATLPPWPYPPR